VTKKKKRDLLPVGEYVGKVYPPFQFLNRIWKGKCFCDDTVVNKVFGYWTLPGKVTRIGERVYIHYPRLHITDTLMEVNEGWLGSMIIFGVKIEFLLEEKWKTDERIGVKL